MTYAQSRASVAAPGQARCRGPHTTVVSRVVFLPEGVSAATPVARRDALGQRYCAPAYRQLVGGTLADRATSLLTWTLFTPSEAQLARGARWLRCEVLARSGNQLVPLTLGRPLLGKGVPEQLRICQTTTGADVSCARPHAFRVEAVFRAVGEAYPDATHLHRHRPGPVPAAGRLLRRLLATPEPGRVGRRRPVHPVPGPPELNQG